MLFLCFSIKDRSNLVNDFSHYISNFGIKTWYDRKNIFLGDNRYETNINQGAKNDKIKYAIVFYSNNFINGNICLEEYKILQERYYKNEIHIFPVFLNNAMSYKDDRFKLCFELVYKVINSHDDFYGLALHIISKICYDQLKLCKYKTIYEIITNVKLEHPLFKLLIEYDNIIKTNYQLRLGLLFSIFNLMELEIDILEQNKKIINYIFHQNCINPLLEEKRELQIYEYIIIYELNRFVNL